VSSSALPLACYAALLGITAAVLWVWSPYALPSALLTGGAVAIAVIALAVAVRDRAEARAPAIEAAERPVPDYSVSILALAYALPTMLVCAYLGLYLILIGGGVLLLGLGGLIREWRAERRAVRRAEGSADAP
jgi:MFS superfamily sulfate permease-like transporter